MASGTTRLVGCFLSQSAASNHPGYGTLLAGAAIVGMFVFTRGLGAIVGEYAKEAYFSRFKNERRKLKSSLDKLAEQNRELQITMEYAAEVIERLQTENATLRRKRNCPDILVKAGPSG